MKALPLLTLALFNLTGCGGSGETPGAKTTAETEAPRVRALRDVLDQKLLTIGPRAKDEAAGSLELRADTGLLPEVDGEPNEAEPEAPATGLDEGLDPGLVELRDGLVGMVIGSPRNLELAKADVLHVGAKMAPVIAAGLRQVERDPAELRVLIDLGSSVPSAEIARALAALAGASREVWLRSYAAWALLPHREAPGADAVVPSLLYRVKYERDPEARTWVAMALAGFGNGAGLADLRRAWARDVAAQRRDAAGAESARNGLAKRLSDNGISEPLSPAEPSTALRAEAWRWISDLSGEHFQLRGVDDARFVLSRLEPWAAYEFAHALEDDDAYVRLHTCQVLGRMGSRGAPAAPSLVAALYDPDEGVRGAAAEALALVQGREAHGALLARLDEPAPNAPGYGLRVGLVRALSQLPGDEAPEGLLPRLRELFDGAPASDMRLASALGLLRWGEHAAVLPWLGEELEASVGDPAGAEAAIGDWLHSEPGGLFGHLRGRWDELGPKGAVIHTAEQAKERRKARAELIQSQL